MTYSIVARCPESGRLAVGIATCLPGVGRVARFVEPGAGAVASQAQLLPAHGTRVLAGLREGAAPADALAASLAVDRSAEHRQVGVVAADGSTAAHTGASCIPYAGHVTGDGYSVQANMMTADGVPQAMAEAFEATAGEHLALRVLAALDAAEALGGDIRGRQSAAVLVRRGTESGVLLQDVVVAARVDDDPEPLVGLRGLVRLDLAYQETLEVERRLAARDVAGAEAALAAARRLAPHDPQVPAFAAIELAAAGYPAPAGPLWAEVTSAPGGERWVELLRRMLAGGLVPEAAAELLDGQRRS